MSDDKSYKFFDHTADIGIKAQGATLAELFVAMAQGVTELIAEDSALEATQTRVIELSAESTESLLLAWLKELLFWFSSDGFLPARYELDAVTPTTLRGRITGDTFDLARHVQGREVKAITRHQLRVSQQHTIWQGQVIVDI